MTLAELQQIREALKTEADDIDNLTSPSDLYYRAAKLLLSDDLSALLSTLADVERERDELRGDNAAFIEAWRDYRENGRQNYQAKFIDDMTSTPGAGAQGIINERHAICRQLDLMTDKWVEGQELINEE